MKKNTPSIISGRTRFGKEIVAEFWMPMKPSFKAIILCDGCPSIPSRHKVGEFFARKGYWVFHPRYRGSWESGGTFLKVSPEEDVLLVAKSLNHGFFDLISQQNYLLDIKEVVVIGASFGGAAAILSLKDPLITKAVALSPVIDWTVPSKDEPFDYFIYLLKEGFEGAYRVHKDAWKKLQEGKFYSPVASAPLLDVSRLFVAHATDDRVVALAPLRAFAKQTKLRPCLLKNGGHFGVRNIMDHEIWKCVSLFLKK